MRHVAVWPTPVGTSPGVVGALLVSPFGALNRNPSNPAAWRSTRRKQHFRDVKKLIPYVKPRKHKNYKSDVANVLFHKLSFRRGRFWLRKRGAVRSITATCQYATCQHIPAQFVTFFSNFAYWWPFDQSLVNVDRPIKICHVKMINCEKVRLPRHICNFCVSAVSRMESRFFVSRKCFFLHLPFQAAGLLGLRFRAPNGITGRAPTTPGEVPTGVGRTFELLIGRSKGLSNKNPK